jgi:hypothetical protein
MTDKKQIARVQYISIFLISVVWALIAFTKGVKFSPDSNIYSGFGDLLIKYDFNYFDFYAHAEVRSTPLPFYFSWITVVAITKVLFGANWDVAIVAINYLAAIYTLTLILKTTQMVTRNLICVVFVGVALIFCYDYYMWVRYVLSETLFASICFSILFLSISLFKDSSRPQKRIAGGLILLVIALFFRPTSPPLVAFILLSILFCFIFKLSASDANKRYQLIISFTFFASVVLASALLIHSYIMLNPENWPFSSFNRLQKWFLIISRDYQSGIIVYARPETYHPIPNDILDYALITLSKFISFFAFDYNGYSKMHALVNYVFFLPIYVLSVFSIAQLYKKESGLSSISWWTIFSCFIFIVLFAFFHSLQQIDFDHRYRVPCLLPLVLLAALGLNELINGFSKKA